MMVWTQTFNGINPTTMVQVTRDDLIRLVVGMQWQTAVALLYYDALADGDGAWLHRDAGDFANTTPACDIVDEWLGVKP